MSQTRQALKNKGRPPLALVILDGWGLAPAGPYNAISQAKTPCFDNLWQNYPHTMLCAHGFCAGLPKDQVGNSEAGHLNIGAGRVVIQDSVNISEAINDKTFFKNPAFLEAIQHAKQYNSQLHLMGILSWDQCPHMSPDHIIALSRLVARHQIKVFLHFFTDGRDAPKHEALKIWQRLQTQLAPDTCEPASVTGRLYLDRKKEWPRTEVIYNALVLGQAENEAPSLEQAIENSYKQGLSDEFIKPVLIRNSRVTAKNNISDNDSIIFYNLRSDRARQLAKPFVQEDFEELNQGAFNRRKVLRNIKFVAMTDFGPDLGQVLTAFPSRDIQQTLPMVLGDHYKQLYISEMEKYAHITYFLNGGFKSPVAGESRILIKSPAVDSYDKAPKMSSKEITELVIENLHQKWYNFIALNFPNADMVGHTGNLQAAQKGCEAVDQCLRKILKCIKAYKGQAIIVADHGNAEVMYSPELEAIDKDPVNTMHTTNPVPFIIYTDKKIKLKGQDSQKPAGRLADVAPTLLDLVELGKPKEMTGESLII
ncbi:MAG: 2,3-bisphosphoglycerate-independent phosphoglycerate mutase [Candidatus Jacksonbacteria bacterium]